LNKRDSIRQRSNEKTGKRFEGRNLNSPAGALLQIWRGEARPGIDSYTEFIWPIVLFSCVVGLLFDDVFRLLIAGLVAFAFLFTENKPVRVRVVDWALILILVFEIQVLIVSQYRANSVRMALGVAVLTVSYCGVRLAIRSSLQVFYLSGLIALAGLWLAVAGLDRFVANVETLRAAGFTQLLAFRFRLFSPPRSWIEGEWFSLLLLVLPFASAMFAYLWQKDRTWLAAMSALPCLGIVVPLTLSLSRAVLWSAVLFFLISISLMVWGRILQLRKGLLVLGYVLVLFALIVSCESFLVPGISKAYLGEDTSQSRSAQGRIAIWRECLEVLKLHPVAGVGSSNAALFLNSSADIEETSGFASRTFSLPLQILTEKGMLGFALYSIFLALIGREFVLSLAHFRWSTRDAMGQHVTRDDYARTAMNCCFGAGLAAVVARELVYSSLFEHALTSALVAILCALMVNQN
jgi:O-antigen ligase